MRLFSFFQNQGGGPPFNHPSPTTHTSTGPRRWEDSVESDRFSPHVHFHTLTPRAAFFIHFKVVNLIVGSLH